MLMELRPSPGKSRLAQRSRTALHPAPKTAIPAIAWLNGTAAKSEIATPVGTVPGPVSGMWRTAGRAAARPALGRWPSVPFNPDAANRKQCRW